MATGIQTGGVDIDTLFMALVTTKRSDVGWQSNGSVDLSNRFEPYTTGTKVATTGLQSVGVDFADLFQNIAVPLVAIGGDWPLTGGQFPDKIGSGAPQEAGFDFSANGQVDAVGQSTITYDYLTEILAGNGDGFWVKHVYSSGDTINTGNAQTNDTYYQLNALRTFGVVQPTSGTRAWNGTVWIAEDASGTGAVGATGVISAQRT